MARNYKRYKAVQILDAVCKSFNWGQVCRALGADDSCGMRTYFKRRCAKLLIEHSHFQRSWNKGKSTGPKREVSYYLKLNGPPINTNELKKKLIESGMKNRACEVCNLDKWLDKPIPIDLDHANGNRRDNRFFNLKILCPNCHAQKTRKQKFNGGMAKLQDALVLGTSGEIRGGGNPSTATNCPIRPMQSHSS